ncbi:MAG TPA: HAMP domain-containing sensor histidine kinase, partial [Elusimicrobiota bacterium]|nr:HAMP domain-containing sensor histidine kinase [Elusimicrobiota bacterium]
YYISHPPDEEQVKRLLAQVKRVADQSQGYVAAFSQFTLPLSPSPRALAMPGWLRDRASAHAVAKSSAIKLSLAAPDAAFVVEADPDLLARVVDAFLDNAAEAMPTGGELVVSLAVEAGQAVFRFRNTGKELAPSMLPDLGKPFLTMKPGRVGLGLGWARRVADAHGGDFGGSNVPGGVEFWLKIPLAPAKPA